MESKRERIYIRTSVSGKRLLQQAAAVQHKNISGFLLENGLVAAKETLADRQFFDLDDDAWEAFQKVLDRSPASKPCL